MGWVQFSLMFIWYTVQITIVMRHNGTYNNYLLTNLHSLQVLITKSGIQVHYYTVRNYIFDKKVTLFEKAEKTSVM